MEISFKNLSLVFAAGCLGGLVNSILVWFFGAIGITAAAGVHLAPPFTLPWLYPRLVWGGIWGVLFLIPWKWSYPLKGLVYSLGPSLVTFFLVLPLQAHKGLFGLQLGTLMPLFVLFYNAVWGLAAGLWLKWGEEK